MNVDENRAHQHSAMRVMRTIKPHMRADRIQAHAVSALVFAVLDLAQAIRELKNDPS